ncbi:DUF4199 domain-containing protein [Aquimarina sp. AD10]|uniref:DUF4199 domain-containing protein n=1 Tax=Aquimarina sp. AD10 TaxID=1714849 RepID=UPI000E4968B6|nr:DUF4199 domain-containing protein [Aquimarina sp. AD10]AXT60184.1 DUF4199 domain-containing protein [Aquimarina sp. AD10]RKN00023.1 DUF4199 family protein [Aquimarina sp. AD10]
MKKNNTSIIKQSTKHGILQGLLIIITTSFKDPYDLDPHWIFFYVQLFVLIIPISYSIYNYKKLNSGFLKLKQAIKIGLIISLIGAIIEVFWTIIRLNIIYPDWLNYRMDINRDQMFQNNPDMSIKKINEEIEWAKKISSTYVYLAVIILNLFLGFVISLVTGVIIYKKKET